MNYVRVSEMKQDSMQGIASDQVIRGGKLKSKEVHTLIP